MEITQKVGIHNRFDIEVIDAKTGEIKQKAKAENVILNRFWNCLAPGWRAGDRIYASYFRYLFYGSGTGTPQSTDSTLFSHVGVKDFIGNDHYYNTSGYTFDYRPAAGIYSAKRQTQFSESEAVGVNFTEVGIGYGTASNNLCTHAMLQDMNGNPISILKTNTDIINIYATVYIHWSGNQIGKIYLGDHFDWGSSYSGNPNVRNCWFGIYADGSLYNYKDALGMGDYGDFTKEGTPFYSNRDKVCQRNLDSSDVESLPCNFDLTTKRLTYSLKRLGINEGNVGGLGGIWLNESTPYAYDATKVNGNFFLRVEDFYPGDDIVGEAVGTGDGSTTRFKTKFDFPENAKVYVNGIEQLSGVTIRRIPRNTIGWYCLYAVPILEGSTESHILYSCIPTTEYQPSSNGVKMYVGHIIKNSISNIGFASAYIEKYNSGTLSLYGCNNLDNNSWTLIHSESSDYSTITIPLNDTTGHYKYYKVTGNYTSSNTITLNGASDDYKAIIFDTPPAQGDVITADYHTPYIAKDADHVLDFNVTIQFGEYTPT